MGVPATLAVLPGIAVYAKPVELWDAATPTREVYREFDDGGVVALDGDTIQYEPPGTDADPRMFEGDEKTARQRAAVGPYETIWVSH